MAKYPQLLMSRVLLSKYCPEGNLNSVRLGSRPSHVWQGVIKVMDIFKEATWWDSYRNTIRWKYSSNGQFTIKSAYELIKKIQRSRGEDVCEQSDGSGLRKFWKRIWLCKVPNKVRIHYWRAYHDSLPDARNLWRRAIKVDRRCKICGADSETITHVAKECRWARELMDRLGLSLPVVDGQVIAPADWIWACVGVLNTEELRSYLIALWMCWKNRCRVWHDQGCWSIDTAVIIGKNVLRLMDTHFWPNPGESIDYAVGRQCPGADALMVFVDGSWDVESRRAGLGVVVVGQDGVVNYVSAIWRTNCSCASEVEGLALLQGFALARSLSIKEACFNTDSLEVFKAIATGSESGDW
ncbi:hypothetical protein QQ045_002240 [Rhodiola kirilowii]